MKRKPELRTKCLSGLASLALVLASVPVMPVFAEEGLEDMEQYEDILPPEEGEEVITESAVYVITDFRDYHKTAEGKFENEEIQNKYGDLRALPGTSMEQLDLPENLIIDGYWKAEGIEESLELTEIDWKLKSDFGEVYSETSPEGSYTFVPDLDAYLLTDEEISEFVLADQDVKLPEISLTIAAQPESEEQEQPEAWGEEQPEVWGEEQTGNIGGIESSEGDIPVNEMDGTDLQNDFVTDASEENIFDGLDDSILDGSESADVEIYDGTDMIPIPEEPVVGDTTVDDLIAEGLDTDDVTDEPATEGLDTDDVTDEPATEALAADGTVDVPSSEEPVTEEASVTPAGEDAAGAQPTEQAPADPQTTEQAPADPQATEQTPADPQSTEQTPADPVAATAEVLLAVTDVNGNVLYEYTDADNNSIITLSADTVYEFPAIGGLYCGADLSALKIRFSSAAAGEAFAVAEVVNGAAVSADSWNFSDGTEKTFEVSEYKDGVATGNKYTVKFAGIAKEAHTPGGNATCTQNAVCSVCGISIPNTTIAHQFSPATCTEPETCIYCGTSGAPAKGHTWIEATCTAPKTCSVCKAVEGEPLGHNWSAATCTAPKTCKRCGATKGKALGHDMNNDWETIEASTDTVHGQQIRYCSRDCGYYEERALNIIGNPDNNAILNLAEGGQYNLNTRITFSAVGAAMGNTDPFDGDVRYVPLSWSIQGTPGSFTDNFTGAFSITKAGTYTVTVIFQKQIYEKGSWKATDITDSRSVTFTVGTLVQGNLTGTADGIRINPQTGDSTPIIPLVLACAAALVVIIGVVIFKKKKK